MVSSSSQIGIAGRTPKLPSENYNSEGSALAEQGEIRDPVSPSRFGSGECRVVSSVKEVVHIGGLC